MKEQNKGQQNIQIKYQKNISKAMKELKEYKDMIIKNQINQTVIMN